jgi:NADH-quinone oxidoreductase subunit E
MCIAACDRAPVIQVNFHYHEHMTKEKVDELIDELRREAADGG